MSEEAVELSEAPPAGGSKLVLMLVALNLLITVAALALFVLQIGPFKPAPMPMAGEVMPPAEELPPAIYESMDKPLVVTYQAGKRQRYLQLIAQFMTRSDETVLALRNHMPAILDEMYSVFSEVDFATVQSLEGRDMLREKIMMTTQEILSAHSSEHTIEAVFFTSYVFQ